MKGYTALDIAVFLRGTAASIDRTYAAVDVSDAMKTLGGIRADTLRGLAECIEEDPHSVEACLRFSGVEPRDLALPVGGG
jgi:hypothetical protein